jgi:type I restriction enzyme S subunit
MSQLFGWEGALALSSAEFEGCFVSPQFPTFLCDGLRLDRRFLGWFMVRPAFWQDLGTRASGMGDRRRTLSPESLFACKIPLPPLAEQRRIVTRIEELAANINEAHGLRRNTIQETEALVTSFHIKLAGSRSKRLGDIVRLDEDQAPVTPTRSYPQVGVKGFGAGLFAKAPVMGPETTYKTFNRLYEGALVLSQVKAWEGAIAICPSNLAGSFVSPEYRTFRCIENEARPSYLSPLVKTQWFWGKVLTATRGVGARRERTRPEQFLDIEIPMPPVEKQLHGERVFAALDVLKQLQASTITEIDALMPSILDRAFNQKL